MFGAKQCHHSTPLRWAVLGLNKMHLWRVQYPTAFTPPLPVAFDWKKNLGPVKDQGRCASCWAFASTSVMEAFISIQSRQAPVPLSPQSMVDCFTEFKCATAAFPLCARLEDFVAL